MAKHFVLGGRISSTIRSAYEDSFTHGLSDGHLHANWMTRSADVNGYDFGPFDRDMKKAEDLSLFSEVHHLVWGYQGSDGTRIGAWMPQAVADAGGDPIPVLGRHIETIVQHLHEKYPDRVSTLAVVNEPLNWDGQYNDIDHGNGVSWTNFWNNSSATYYGDARYYIAESFRIADRAVRLGTAPNDRPIKLITNDWAGELGGTLKGDGYLNLAYYLVDQGAPVDGWGFQMHLWPGDDNRAYRFYDGTTNALRNETEILAFAERFKLHALSFPGGVPPYITEFSLDPSGWVARGYTAADIRYLTGLTVYVVAKALIDAGGRSMMFYESSILAKQGDGEPVHQLRRAIEEIPATT